VLALFREVAARSAIVVVATHDLEVAAICHRTLALGAAA
jgi:ABC-type lipoprotein export system ATPase subunit